MSSLPGLRTRCLGQHYHHFPTLDSTNTYLKENAGGLPHGAAVTASLQTAGKGRLGKSWSARRDTSLALSVLLHGRQPGEMAVLPLLAGLAVCRGVEAAAGAVCALKWSNDVLLGERKLCGILCESRIAGDRSFAVVGMGVNLTQSKEDFSHLGLVYATSLLMATGKSPEGPLLAAEILAALEEILEEYDRDGFGALREAYRSRCVTLGKRVRVTLDGAEQEGTAVDIAPDGALLCTIAGVLRPVSAGETSVRGLYGYT